MTPRSALLATTLAAALAVCDVAGAGAHGLRPPRAGGPAPVLEAPPAAHPAGATLAPAGSGPEAAGSNSAPPQPPASYPPAAASSWGENYIGQLGTVFRDSYEQSPGPVEGLGNIVAVAAGSSFNLALLSDGTVVSWGGNHHGQLGDDTQRGNWEHGAAHVVVQEESPSTHAVLGPLRGVTAIAAADEHAVALISGGTVMTWGNDEYGQLGDGTQGFEKEINVNERLPKPVPGLSSVRAVAAGGGSDFALTADGQVYAWGADTEGQLGLGRPAPDHCETEVAHYPRFEACSERPLPVMWRNPATGREEPLAGARSIAAGNFAAYAVLEDGEVVAWGSNRDGELGTGGETVHPGGMPADLVRTASGEPLGGVVELAAGTGFALARLHGAGVVGWGSAQSGALAGVGSEDCRKPPTQRREQLRESEGRSVPGSRLCAGTATPIPALEKLAPQQLAAGAHYGLALSDGKVFAWGSNERGQLGLGRTPKARFNGKNGEREREAGSPTPVRVTGIGAAQAVFAGGTHSVVLLAPSAAPPPPLVSVAPGPLTLSLAWLPETPDGRERILAERLVYRPFERLAEAEPAEEGAAPEEDGPPVAIASEPPAITVSGEQLEAQAPIEGQRLSAEPGGWSGARPITFAYQWQRCDPAGEGCADIRGAAHPNYKPLAADLGRALRVLVTATGPEGSGTAASPPTAPVEPARETERRRTPPTAVRVVGLSGFSIVHTIEKLPIKSGGRFEEVTRPLQAVPYEVRFYASGRSRVMVLTPLP